MGKMKEKHILIVGSEDEYFENIFEVSPGCSIHSQTTRDDLMVDDFLLKNFLQILNLKISVDYENLKVDME